MKKIEGVIGAVALDAVTKALAAEGVGGMTICEVAGAAGRGHAACYRGVAYRAPDVKMKLELVVGDDDAVALVRVIRRSAAGDPKMHIWLSDVVEPRDGLAAQVFGLAV